MKQQSRWNVEKARPTLHRRNKAVDLWSRQLYHVMISWHYMSGRKIWWDIWSHVFRCQTFLCVLLRVSIFLAFSRLDLVYEETTAIHFFYIRFGVKSFYWFCGTDSWRVTMTVINRTGGLCGIKLTDLVMTDCWTHCGREIKASGWTHTCGNFFK